MALGVLESTQSDRLETSSFTDIPGFDVANDRRVEFAETDRVAILAGGLRSVIFDIDQAPYINKSDFDRIINKIPKHELQVIKVTKTPDGVAAIFWDNAGIVHFDSKLVGRRNDKAITYVIDVNDYYNGSNQISSEENRQRIFENVAAYQRLQPEF